MGASRQRPCSCPGGVEHEEHGDETRRQEKDREKANRVAQIRPAALTAELATQPKRRPAWCDQPPGLDDLTGHIEAT